MSEPMVTFTVTQTVAARWVDLESPLATIEQEAVKLGLPGRTEDQNGDDYMYMLANQPSPEGRELWSKLIMVMVAGNDPTHRDDDLEVDDWSVGS